MEEWRSRIRERKTGRSSMSLARIAENGSSCSRNALASVMAPPCMRHFQWRPGKERMRISCRDRRASSSAQRRCEPVKNGSTRQIRFRLESFDWFCDTLVRIAAATSLVAATADRCRSWSLASIHIKPVATCDHSFDWNAAFGMLR